jgi:hypothetical protein
MKCNRTATGCLIFIIFIFLGLFSSGCIINEGDYRESLEKQVWDTDVVLERIAYEESVRRKVFENFVDFDSCPSSGDIFVSFEIFPDGKLFEPSIQFSESTSKDECLRLSAAEIIKKSTTFPPIP